MKLGKIVMIMMAAMLGAMVLVGGCFYSGYNNAVGLDETVKTKWAQVENQLQRRFDLIPNLVATVKGIVGQEKDVFLGIAKSREAYFQAKSPAEKAHAATGLEGALSRLMVLRESYPELKSNQAFQNLQVSIEGTENRVGVERKRYNEAVRALNTFSRGLLGRLYCSFADVEKAEYFQVADEAKAVPKVDFSGG